MRELVESILTGNNVEAHRLFESRLNDIREKKLYEAKRMLQAEVFGGMSKEDLQKRKDAGFMKASDYYEIMDKLKQVTDQAKNKSTTASKPKTKKKLEEMQFQGKSEKDIRAAAAGLGQRLGQAIAGAAEAQGKEPEDKPKQTPRDISSLRDMAWSKSEKSKKGPYLKRIEASKQKASQQKRVDKIAGQAIKNLAGGKDIGKNIGRIAKYGKQSSAIKSIKGGHDVWMGKKDPTTLKGHGIALVRDIFKG
jgi:hypothetical protein